MATYLNTLWDRVLRIALSSRTWIIASIVTYLTAYQYEWLGYVDRFWFIGVAFGALFASVACHLFSSDYHTRICTAIFLGLAFNNVIKEIFGTPAELNIYDYYGAAVTVAIIVYEQHKKTANDSDGNRSDTNHGQ